MKEIIIHTEKDKQIVMLVENGKLIERYEEENNNKRLEGNIYLGIVKNVLPGMQACFVDIGEKKNAFMHIRDIIPKKSSLTGNRDEDLNNYDIKDYCKTGKPVIVQVKRDKTDKKGDRISTHINIVGKYVVYIPNSNIVTVSQKITNKEEREKLINFVKPLLGKDEGLIIRTIGARFDKNVIKNDIDLQRKKWKMIQEKAEGKNVPTKLFEEDGIIEKVLLDLSEDNIEKVIVDDEGTKIMVQKILNNLQSKLFIEYSENDVRNKYNLRKELKEAEERKIWLKCGGFITIDKTEALIAVDVNSGKFTGNRNLEKTVYQVNKEATIEIAKQLRLKDLGGIIIIDYIDMKDQINRKNILQLLQNELMKDRAKTQIIGFTKLDLLEMTRKHIFCI